MLLSLVACAPVAIKTVPVTVYRPTYVALPSELTLAAPLPKFPDVLTNGSLADYVQELQLALKIDINKLEQIHKLQPVNQQ